MSGLWSNPYSGYNWANSDYDTSYLNSDEGAQSAYQLMMNWLSAPYAGKSWLTSQYGKLRNDYGAAQARDKSLNWLDYLSGLNLSGMYGSVSPYERGEKPSVYSPRIRYLGW